MPTLCHRYIFMPALLPFITLLVMALHFAAKADIYTVTTTNDNGAGSLRQAILNANATPGTNTIQFNLTGTAPFTILPASALPVVTNAVTIDGTTQTGYANAPVVEICGTNAGTGVIGLQLNANFSAIIGLAINRFTGYGIYISGISNTLWGNFIGTDITGKKTGFGNLFSGIFLTNAVATQIGGTNGNTRNVVSGNGQNGVILAGLNTYGNSIQGNYIGLDVSGSSAINNTNYGICVFGSPGNIFGPGNVISGNGFSGISFIGSGSTTNTVVGNFIGTDATGKIAVGNLGGGMYFATNATANQIGGTTNAGNVISGNFQHGISFTSGSNSNSVQGNLIGVAAAGTNALPNRYDGIDINGTSANTIGGTTRSLRNIISGNTYSGVEIALSNACYNVVNNNFIGTDITGMKAISNALAGVFIQGSTNTIGGTLKNGIGGNVIAGNGQQGILLKGTNGSASGNLVIGNFIGVDVTGTNGLGNGAGIEITGASSNQIGGTSSSQRNVISTNNSYGVYLLGTGTSGNLIEGNYIGTDSSGTKSLGNINEGIHAEAVTNNTIGGAVAGAGNLISGNLRGIWLTNAGGFVIQGNIVGLNAAGTAALKNTAEGILLEPAIATNWIGGTNALARNVISGNGTYGISLIGSSAQIIQGNYIGPNVTGTAAIGNGIGDGILLQQANSNAIGGITTGAGNVISGNNNFASGYGSDGMYITNSSQNTIQGNYIGLAADGISPLGNAAHNVEFDLGSTNNVLGVTGAGNYIANALNYTGVRVRSGAYNNLISGNCIYSNKTYGIDLGTSGPNAITHLQAGVSGTDANRLQNFPALSNAVSDTATVIRGSLDSVLNNSYRLEFFASPAGNANGYGQGQIFLGQTNLTISGISPSNFSVVLPVAVPAGWVVSATATDTTNNTSEFSNWTTVVPAPALKVGTKYFTVLKQYTVTVTNKSGGTQQVQEQLTALTGFTLLWTNATGFSLQQTTNLNPPQWTAAGITPVLSNGTYSLLITNAGLYTNPPTFYRLVGQ